MIKLSSYFTLALLLSSVAFGQVNVKPKEFDDIDVVNKLGTQIPLDLTFQDETGKDVKLSDYFNKGKPVVLNLAYYSCPMLCTFVLNTVSETVVKIPNWKAGREYQLLTVTIDSREKYELAAEKKKNYLESIKSTDDKAWTFLTDPHDNAKKLAEAVGFKYFYDPKIAEFAHPAVTFVLTEDGKLSRDLFGLNYQAKDLKLALLEASKGKIGNTIEKILLFCYHYDPNARGYVLFAQNVMKIGGAVTVLLLGLFLGFFWKMDKARYNKAA